MRHLTCLRIWLFGMCLFTIGFSQSVSSGLWGNQGELWDPGTSILRDFTNVGYKGGAEPIPDWPVAHSVTDFGAIPDDGIDDAQAFLDAIAACPPNHAVLIPRGKFTILQKVEVTKDNVCLRGEDMVESVIFFPKYIGEIYIEENGFGTGFNPIYEFFFKMNGGTGQGVENLTFQFREQRNKGAWEYEGAGAIEFKGVTDGWLKNIVFLNYSSGMRVQSSYCSFINLVFDQYNARCGTDYDSTKSLDAYGAILVRNSSYNLYHNISVEGYVLQPIDLNEAAIHSVYSQYRGAERNTRAIGYHGGSSNYNLYTDLNKGVVQSGNNPRRAHETYWNVLDNYQYSLVEEETYNGSNSLIFVGYGDDWPAKTDDPLLWYEPAHYGQMNPPNLYLAQLDYFGKPRPEDPPSPPSPYEGDVFGVVPTDDIKEGNWFYKFDLSEIHLPAIAHARLRVHMDNRKVSNPPYRIAAWSVTDDAWSEDTMTSTNQPALVSELDDLWFEHEEDNRVLEFDVTSFVQSQVIGGDGVVSLAIDITGGTPSLFFKDNGPRPELVIERVPDPIPGPPSAPRNIGTTPMIGNILLDWEDHPEPGVTYNVYRSPYKVAADGEYTYGYGDYIDTGLVTSDIADIQSTMNWLPGCMYYGVVYRYKIAAVDEHGYESPRSVEIYAATLHPSNDPPAFTETISLANATAHFEYSEHLADKASDPESDPLHFHIVSGPDWLSVSSDGTLSGVPAWSDEGLNEFTFQVTAIGGSVQKVVNIQVELPADDPPGAPAAPAHLIATAGDGEVSLDWDDNSEADLAGYTVYRSITSGSGYTEIEQGLGVSDLVDTTVVNGTTYYYRVTAVDHNGNASANSMASATPLDAPPVAPTGLTATPGNGSVFLDWADNVDVDLASYRVYRSTTAGSYGVALATGQTISEYVDDSATNDTTYFYVVTAVDAVNNESVQSNQVSATPDGAIVSFAFDFGSGGDDIQSAGLIPYVENTGPGDMLVTDNPGDGNIGIALYNEQNSQAREAQGFYRTFPGLELNEPNDFVIEMTFTTPLLNWNQPHIGIHLFGDTTSGAFWNTGLFASVDKKQNLEIWSGGVENGSVLNTALLPQQMLSESLTTLEVVGTYGTYGADNLQLVMTVSAEGIDPTSVTATVDTTGFSATQTGFGVSANTDDANRFVVKTFSVETRTGPQNQAPVFTTDPILKDNATEGSMYNGSLDEDAFDPESNPLTFSLASAPSWLSVSSDGTLSGTPGASDVGHHQFTVQVDATGGTDTAILEITVDASPNQPPTVDFIQPLNGATVGAGTNLYVKVSASDLEGPVDFVRLYLDGQLVRQENAEPYEWGAAGQNDPLLQNMAEGTYVLEAIATDDDAASTSKSITITVLPATPELRVTEYYLSTGDFTGTTATVTLHQNLAEDYYILVRGARTGDGLLNPDSGYARVSAVPGGKGDLAHSGALNQIQLVRYASDSDWEGVVTVVECGNASSAAGFTLVDVLETTLTGNSGTDTSASWTELNRVVLFGGYRGGGASLLAATDSRNQSASVFTRLYPSGSGTLHWSRDPAGEMQVDAVITTFVVEWGSEWNVQHVNVSGNNGGNGADAPGEYTTAIINPVNRDHTWVWGTGTRMDAGIGDCAESCLVTLGDGVNQNASEGTVAVGSEYSDAYDFDVYVMTHPAIDVDHVFKADGDGTGLDVSVSVAPTVSGCRFGWVYNGVDGTGSHHPRDIFWARYTADDEVTISRGYKGKTFPAWVQGVDFSGLNE